MSVRDKIKLRNELRNCHPEAGKLIDANIVLAEENRRLLAEMEVIKADESAIVKDLLHENDLLREEIARLKGQRP